MIYYALVFLIVGLVAGALGLFGIAAIAGHRPPRHPSGERATRIDTVTGGAL